MYDNIMIGGERISVCSATSIGSVKGIDNISENSESYWVNDSLFDMRVVIFKNHPTGLALAKLIKKGCAGRLRKFLNEVVIRTASPEKLVFLIKEFGRNRFLEGELSAKNKIRDVWNSLGGDKGVDDDYKGFKKESPHALAVG